LLLRLECVTSLNMRKWMRDRLQRRKKKDPEGAAQAAPPPLQPAYFDADQAGNVPEASDEGEVPASAEPQFEAQPDRAEASDAEPVEAAGEAGVKPATESRRRPQSGEQGQRGRRKRGGRGRGGSGRERAVASAFTPAAVKGLTPVIPEDEVAPEVDAPEESPAPEAAPIPAAPKVPAAVPAAAPRPPKGIVVLAIGLPGSGKSSWFKRHNLSPLSSDMMRTLLFDDVREQRFQDLVFSNLRSMLKARLIAKRPMNYVDATNLTPQERQHWIKLAKDYNYEVQAVFFDVPLEVCLERHQRRDRVVPEDIMRRMAAKLKAPDFSEGFAKITVVRVKKKDEPAPA
jgi:predicted kinase